ncbi:MAG: Spx/MgsR family RNA polymerase-binding regulatory protein [bacterium]
MNKFIHYPRCSTCVKAKNVIEGKIPFEERDIKLDKLSFDELKEIYNKSNLPIKRLINTSGLLYKEYKLKDKIPNMTDDEILELLSTDGMLVKRPILIIEDKVLIGFKEEEYLKVI